MKTSLQLQLRKAMQLIEKGSEGSYFYQALGQVGVDGEVQNIIGSVFQDGHIPSEDKTARILALGLVAEMAKTGDLVRMDDVQKSWIGC